MLRRSKILRWAAAIGIVAAGVVLLVARGGARDIEQLTLGEVPLPALSLLYAAHGHGLFAREGVEVRQRRFAAGRDALEALVAREVDVATVFEVPVARRAFDPPGLRILSTLSTSRRNNRLVARGDRGIRDASGLRGKRVGVPIGTNAELFLETFLAAAGVRSGEVERVNLRPQDTGPSLARGDVDAVAIWLPHARRVDVPTLEILSDAYVEVSMLVTREDVLATRVEALRRMMRALAAAEQLLEKEPEAALDDLARELPGGSAAELQDDLRRNTPQLGLSNVQLRVLDRAAEWHIARGAPAGRTPDFRAMLAPALLLEIAPESVTLLDLD